MYDNFKTYNYSNSLVTPDGYGRHEGAYLSGDIINGFETVIGTGLQVTIKPGNAILRVGTGGTRSARMVSLVADFTSTLATADAANPRIDAIVVFVNTSVNLPGGTPTAANQDGPGVTQVRYVTGTPNANPVAPDATAIQAAIGSASYPYTVIATWRVNAGATTLSQANCTDTRTFAAPTNPRGLGLNSTVEPGGGVPSFTTNTLNGAITAGTAWINAGGVLVPQPFSALSFTAAASKDRYYYVTLGSSTIQAATDVSNNAAQPPLPARSVWLTKVVTDATKITSVTDIRSGLVGAASIDPNSFPVIYSQANNGASRQTVAASSVVTVVGTVVSYTNALSRPVTIMVSASALIQMGSSGSMFFIYARGARASRAHYVDNNLVGAFATYRCAVPVEVAGGETLTLDARVSTTGTAATVANSSADVGLGYSPELSVVTLPGKLMVLL